MKTDRANKTRGFTLIELMIVMAVIVILTPTIYRFYHRAVDRPNRDLNLTADSLNRVRLVFSALEKDLAQSIRMPGSFGQLKRGPQTLIIEAVNPEQSRLLLSQHGDLTGKTPPTCIIVYRLESTVLTRWIYYPGREEGGKPARGQVLMTGLAELSFTPGGPDPIDPGWIEVKLTPKHLDPSTRTMGRFTQIMGRP